MRPIGNRRSIVVVLLYFDIMLKVLTDFFVNVNALINMCRLTSIAQKTKSRIYTFIMSKYNNTTSVSHHIYMLLYTIVPLCVNILKNNINNPLKIKIGSNLTFKVFFFNRVILAKWCILVYQKNNIYNGGNFPKDGREMGKHPPYHVLHIRSNIQVWILMQPITSKYHLL